MSASGGAIQTVDGGSGFDRLDTSASSSNVVINLITGTSNINVEMVSIENVLTGGGNDQINGNNVANFIQTNAGDDLINGRGGNDLIFAGEGNNRLNGGLGNDQMSAGSGNDIFYVDSDFDGISDAGGFDLVRATISYHLDGGIENLQLITADDLDATGNDVDNVIWGNAGNNVIDGLGGADILRGNDGDDTYYVDNVGDRVVESTNHDGYDIVRSTVTFTLWDRVEQLELLGSENLNGFGSDMANSLYGNIGNNLLNGLGGNDVLYGDEGTDRLLGSAGDDTLDGGFGNDQLTGGAGRDVLTGGFGSDAFIFADGDFGTSTATADRITGFGHAEADKIRLNLSDANINVDGNQGYTFIGTQAFHKIAGELRYQQINGNTYVYGDTDGDGSHDWVIRVDGLVNFVASDFVL